MRHPCGGLGGGSFQPGPTYYTLPLPDGNVVAWSNASNISQTLTGIGLQPNTTYTLSVYIGHRSDNLATTYSVSLLAGSTTLNTVSGSNSTIPLGQFAKVTLTYTTGSTVTPGDLSIVLGSGGQQIDFDAVSLTTSGGVYYYVEDLLGSSRVMTTAAGAVCYDGDFDPYGGEHTYTDTCPQNYKFEGKERDTETGNDDFGARYYSNRFGRWLSADWSSVPVAVPYANLTNPQTLNLYSMVADDPESFADLDGHCGQVVLPGAPAAACTNPPNNTPPTTGESPGNTGTGGAASSQQTQQAAAAQAAQNAQVESRRVEVNYSYVIDSTAGIGALVTTKTTTEVLVSPDGTRTDRVTTTQVAFGMSEGHEQQFLGAVQRVDSVSTRDGAVTGTSRSTTALDFGQASAAMGKTMMNQLREATGPNRDVYYARATIADYHSHPEKYWAAGYAIGRLIWGKPDVKTLWDAIVAGGFALSDAAKHWRDP